MHRPISYVTVSYLVVTNIGHKFSCCYVFRTTSHNNYIGFSGLILGLSLRNHLSKTLAFATRVHKTSWFYFVCLGQFSSQVSDHTTSYDQYVVILAMRWKCWQSPFLFGPFFGCSKLGFFLSSWRLMSWARNVSHSSVSSLHRELRVLLFISSCWTFC